MRIPSVGLRISSSASHYLHPANTLQPCSNTHDCEDEEDDDDDETHHPVPPSSTLFTEGVSGSPPETSTAKINPRNSLIALSTNAVWAEMFYDV